MLILYAYRITRQLARGTERRVSYAFDFSDPLLPVIKALHLARRESYSRFIPTTHTKSDNDEAAGISIDRALRLASSYGPVRSNSSNRTGRG